MTENDVLQDLELDTAAWRLDVPPGDVHRVMARGRARQRHRKAGMAVLSAVALLGGGSFVIRTGDGPGTEVRSADSVLRGDVPMSWRTVTPESGLGYARGFGSRAGAAPLYALSTAPGTADLGKPSQSRVIWKSDDGIEWTAAKTFGPDLYLSDLAVAGERLYAVGTGQAVAAAAGGRKVSPVLVGWSDDGAKSWQRSDLDIDLGSISAVTTSQMVAATDVAAGPAGTVAVVLMTAVLDVRAVLPDGIEAPNGWALTREGVDLLDSDTYECRIGNPPPNQGRPPGRGRDEANRPGPVDPVPCFEGEDFVESISPQEAFGVTASYSWSQLGIDGDVLRAVLREPFVYFAAPDSNEFRRVDLPLADSSFEVMVEAVDDGFDLAVTGALGPVPDGATKVTMFHSADGRAWERIGDATGLDWVTAMGRLDGRPAMIGQTRRGAVLARSNGDGSWTSTELIRAVDPSITADSTVQPVAAGIGPLGAVVAVVVVNENEKPSQLTPRLLVTRDGETWSDSALDDLAGQKVRGVTRIVVAGDRALVTVGAASKDGDRLRQLVLVGSPA